MEDVVSDLFTSAVSNTEKNQTGQTDMQTDTRTQRQKKGWQTEGRTFLSADKHTYKKNPLKYSFVDENTDRILFLWKKKESRKERENLQTKWNNAYNSICCHPQTRTTHDRSLEIHQLFGEKHQVWGNNDSPRTTSLYKPMISHEPHTTRLSNYSVSFLPEQRLLSFF